ncbi:MAG: hypothetical protein BWY05_01127 [Euryarchaeota archaeon ADurb.Bin165]|nr:MAG: hypothetical protein BWY05_01127 [Euryarchaeota archaeon ADurb.Bin165]
MGLTKTSISTGNHISIIPDERKFVEDHELKTGRMIQNYYGKYLFFPDTPDIVVSLFPTAIHDAKARSMSFKTLTIAITYGMQNQGAIMLHTATLVRDNEAILIAASSGGGKSTTASRLIPPWHAPGDECCIVLPGDGEYCVFALPTWSQVLEDTERKKMWNTQKSYKLKAFCVLVQDTYDAMEKIGKAQSIAAITGSARQATLIQLDKSGKDFNQDFFSGCYRTAEKMVQDIPAFILRTTLTGSFWEEIEHKLWKTHNDPVLSI